MSKPRPHNDIVVVENHQKKAVVIDVAIPSDSQQHLEEGTREA